MSQFDPVPKQVWAVWNPDGQFLWFQNVEYGIPMAWYVSRLINIGDDDGNKESSSA